MRLRILTFLFMPLSTIVFMGKMAVERKKMNAYSTRIRVAFAWSCGCSGGLVRYKQPVSWRMAYAGIVRTQCSVAASHLLRCRGVTVYPKAHIDPADG